MGGYFAPDTIGGRAYFAPDMPPVVEVGVNLPPTLEGGISLTATIGAHVAWQASIDSDVAGYELSCDLGVPAWIDVGNVLEADLMDLTAATDYTVRVRAYDLAGQFSGPITALLRTGTAPGPAPAGLKVPRLASSSKFRLSNGRLVLAA